MITDSARVVDEGGRVGVTYASGQQSRGTIVGYDQLSGLGLIEVPNTRYEMFPTLGSVAGLQVARPGAGRRGQDLVGGFGIPGVGHRRGSGSRSDQRTGDTDPDRGERLIRHSDSSFRRTARQPAG